MNSRRCRSGASSPNRTPASPLTNASPGNRRFLRQMAPPPLIARLPAAPRNLLRKLAEARSYTPEMPASARNGALTGPPALANFTGRATLGSPGALGFPIRSHEAVALAPKNSENMDTGMTS